MTYKAEHDMKLAEDFREAFQALVDAGIFSESYIKVVTSAANHAHREAKERLFQEMKGEQK